MSETITEAEALAARTAVVGNIPAMRSAKAWLDIDANLTGLSDDDKAKAIIARGQLGTLILEAENIQLGKIVDEGATFTKDLEAALGELNHAVDNIQQTTAILGAATKVIGLVGRILALV
jgi:flagellin-like hook-associated protein FlgL